MAYYTIDDARRAATSSYGTTVLTASAARDVLSQEARTHAGLSSTFDIFLSHSFSDQQVILGVKRILERTGRTVYVDWIDDPSLDRANVTAATAATLRTRMQASHSLIFATSASSVSSKWMPWELGYFDGLRGERIAVLPLVASDGGSYVGQEYLGLYPKIERLEQQPWVVKRGQRIEVASVNSFASRSGPTFRTT